MQTETFIALDDAELLHGDDPTFVFMTRAALEQEALHWCRAVDPLERSQGQPLTKAARIAISLRLESLLPTEAPSVAELSKLCALALAPPFRSQLVQMCSNYLYLLRHSDAQGPSGLPMTLFACHPMWKRRWIRTFQDGFYPVWAGWLDLLIPME